MDLTSQLKRNLYGSRPKAEEERQAILKFLELEKQIDEENATAIEYMNREHLTKTRSKQVDAAVKRWSKDSKRNINNYKGCYLYNHAEPRSWYSL